MIARIPPVRHVTETVTTTASVRRTDKVPPYLTGGITVLGAGTRPPPRARRPPRPRHLAEPATASYPTVVLGAGAAHTLGIDHLNPPVAVWIGRRWFTVIGILRPVALAPELDQAALVGIPAAHRFLAADTHPTTIYVRTDPTKRCAVRDVLARTANPANPQDVTVSRPSDALAAADRRQGRLQHPAARPRRDRAHRRRGRDRQRDGDGDHPAAHRDRPAPRARRHPTPHRDPIHGRGADPLSARRRGRDPRRASRSPPATRMPATGAPPSRRRCSPAPRRRPRLRTDRRPLPRRPRRPPLTDRRPPVHQLTAPSPPPPRERRRPRATLPIEPAQARRSAQPIAKDPHDEDVHDRAYRVNPRTWHACALLHQ